MTATRTLYQVHQQVMAQAKKQKIHGTERAVAGVIPDKRSGPSIVPVSPYNACEITWHIWEQQAVEVCGVVPAAAIVPALPSTMHIPPL